MGSDNAGVDRLTGTGAGDAPRWDRFAQWGHWPARALLALVAALLPFAALTPFDREHTVAPLAPDRHTALVQPTRDDDLAFYDRVIERIAGGESYYDFILDEQRARDYPVRPGITVRLPTLAYLHAMLGERGMTVLAAALLAATLAAWWRRLGDEPGGERHRLVAIALLAASATLGLNRWFFVLHELWAGMLIALAFGLHRPGRWGWALAVTALALAIREHVLPFVLLLAAMAAWRRDWREAAAWAGLVLLFLVGIGAHLAVLSPEILASDPQGPGWLALRGLAGWLGNVVLSSNLRFLPHGIAGPIVLLALLGWAGWKSAAGTTGTLLYFGYAIAFMLAGRANNFYWGAVIAPAMFVGLAFLPMAGASLLRAARERR